MNVLLLSSILQRTQTDIDDSVGDYADKCERRRPEVPQLDHAAPLSWRDKLQWVLYAFLWTKKERGRDGQRGGRKEREKREMERKRQIEREKHRKVT